MNIGLSFSDASMRKIVLEGVALNFVVGAGLCDEGCGV
jgi:hypothetical protein